MHQVTTMTAAHTTRARLLAAILAAAFSLASLASAAPALATTRGDGLRAAANEERADRGRSPVVGTSLLDDIADNRADRMRDRKKLEHDMDYVRNRLVGSGVCWTSFGEIIAWRSGGDYSYDATITQWMNSDPHRQILLSDDFNSAGGSWATASDGGHYSVMIFVTLCSRELSDSPQLLRPEQHYSPDRQMIFHDGMHEAYKLSANGKVLATETWMAPDRSLAESAGRSRVDGKAYLKVSSGPLAGYWVREASWQFVRGMTEKNAYRSTRRVSLERGTYAVTRFDRLGRATDVRWRSFDTEVRRQVSARAVINGRGFFLVDGGPWDGYWLRDTDAVDRLW